MIQTMFHGLCMAVADSVPGVSGGTIAFILGFYDRFIEALHDLFGKKKEKRTEAAVYLMKLGIGWCVGMGASVLVLSGLFEKNIYFMSSVFLGLTLAALPFIIRAEKEVLEGKLSNLPFAFLGALLVVGISLLRLGSGAAGGLDFQQLQPLQLVYVLISGMAAISAMVLPGISGSTVLLIAGVYLPTVSAVKQLLGFDLSVFPGLAALGIGVLAGAAVSIRYIRRALRHYRSQMVYLILGLTVGSLAAIVMGPTTMRNPQPALSLQNFSLVGVILGMVILFGLEFLRDRLSETESEVSERKEARGHGHRLGNSELDS